MSDTVSPPPSAPPPSPPAGTTPIRLAAQRRRNGRWFLLLALTPVIFLGLYAAGAFATGGQTPVVDPLSVPHGYTAVTDGYYGFAIPSAWKENSAFSDSDGDTYYDGRGGWAGESERVAAVSPTPSTAVPQPLWAFGTPRPTAFTLVGGHPATVPGATFAWAVTLTRPGGFRASALDVWERRSQTELWLVVRGSSATEARVLATLQGSATN
jgi:hypothetical protein